MAEKKNKHAKSMRPQNYLSKRTGKCSEIQFGDDYRLKEPGILFPQTLKGRWTLCCFPIRLYAATETKKTLKDIVSIFGILRVN
jgi:hypothetical protein